MLTVLLACTGTSEPVSVDLGAPSLVPQPVLVEDGEGSFLLDEGTTISGGAVAELLAEALRPATGLPLPVVDDGDIALVIEAGLGPEAYTLDADESGVVIVASDEAGLFYGTQTFRQLLPDEVFATEDQDVEWRLPSVHIEDAPRFAWRGLMIDVARHFFTVEDIERQIDLVALHKMNRLHLHLTDDQGWRIEITSWPDLTTIGGSTEVGGGAGGWYTQEEYAGIVAYAAARSVTVVPEVDFPGHANAALASYAELNESGVAADLYTGVGVISTPLWLESDVTWGFVEDVWGEIAAITPGEHLHVGADEAVYVSDEDYAEFVPWLQEVIGGRTMVGWDEIGVVELEPPFVAQQWYDADNARAAVSGGGTLIASPAEHTYLDMAHDGDAEYGQLWAGLVNVEAAYDWDPVPEEVDESKVLGVEGALWTELIDDVEKMDFMVWPRLVALAEVGWTPAELRDWEDFRDRLATDGARLDALGVGYYRSPEIDW